MTHTSINGAAVSNMSSSFSSSFSCDLAISAVASDAGLVTELSTELSTRLRAAPAWHAETTQDASAPAEPLIGPLTAAYSRVALILHQQLWRHDALTQQDATELHDRLRERPGSVCVMTLDDSPLPRWLATSPRYDLAASGRAGAVEFVVEVIESAGGSVKGTQRTDDVPPRPRWPEPPTPFLGQPRAHTALRHELDAIIAALKAEIERCRAALPEGLFELHVLPYRVIARLDDVAITVSWVSGRMPTIAAGRLLVIAWRNVAAGVRGVAALKAAAQMYERVYSADGNAPDQWRWRADDPTSQPYSSENLAAEWIARAGIARAV